MHDDKLTACWNR